MQEFIMRIYYYKRLIIELLIITQNKNIYYNDTKCVNNAKR